MIFHREGRIVNSSCWARHLDGTAGLDLCICTRSVTDMSITYLLAHIINSNCLNLDRLLKVDVMSVSANGYQALIFQIWAIYERVLLIKLHG